VTRRFALRSPKIAPFLLVPAFVLAVSIAGFVSPAAANAKYAAVVVDGNSGRTLFARNADAQRYPASLTKMMTLYVVFEEMDAGRLKLDSRLSVSANAAKQSPSKLGLRAGSSISVEDAIKGLVTKSANDVAVVVAENIGGSVAGFAGRMNRAARALGMNQTTFRNPHGLPNSGQVTTANDLVRLARGLQDRFPGYYKYFETRSFTYRGARYGNHNRLLGSVKGVDGIKTGYIRASGFNLVTNVRRDGRHIIAVVMGGKTAASRDAHMRELIAKYLPEASRGDRTAPLLIADTGALPVAEARIPRARPETETPSVLAYAGAEGPRDIVSAAMAEAAIPQGDVSGAAEPMDPVAERISAATEVAELASDDAPGQAADPIARLTQLARLRAGKADIIAEGPAAGEEAASGQAGWHIQIGAVPTEQGAEALIEKAQASMGEALASRFPLTQEIEHKGTKLYRARFAGFTDKAEARAACDRLKKKSFACLAVLN